MDNDLKLKAQEEWQENWEHLDSQGLARKLLESIEYGGRSALEFKKLTEDDRKTVEKSLKQLRPAFDEFCKWFIEPLRENSPSSADYGYEKLWAIMAYAWALGAKADVP